MLTTFKICLMAIATYISVLGSGSNVITTESQNNFQIECWKQALENVQNQIELQLIELENAGLYDGLNEEQISEIKEAMSMATMHYNYDVNPLEVTGKDREILEALVYGEAGDEGFAGQCLVAQCLRDTMSRMKTTDVKKVIKTFKYAGRTDRGTSQSCKDAVAFIFDNGGFVVKQRVIYFYAPHMVESKFHESQDFVIEWGGHRFFDDSGWE